MTMKTDDQYHRPPPTIDRAPVVKTLAITLATNDRDLGLAVRQAFNLAKSSGRELTLDFTGAKCAPQRV
jgi:hypothetical protein